MCVGAVPDLDRIAGQMLSRGQIFCFKKIQICSIQQCANFALMKKWVSILLVLACSFFCATNTKAQCSVCTKTVSQMGEKPARGLNQGILYLMAAPFAIIGFIGYRWWKNNSHSE
jgi:hypothetical protein